jgi:plasmid stability protein
MTSITIQLDDEVAATLRRLAASQDRSETEIVREALAAYAQTVRPLPKGIGKYHSGRKDTSDKADDILCDAVSDSQYPHFRSTLLVLPPATPR